jgi:hypothetical protein
LRVITAAFAKLAPEGRFSAESFAVRHMSRGHETFNATQLTFAALLQAFSSLPSAIGAPLFAAMLDYDRAPSLRRVHTSTQHDTCCQHAT